VAARVRPSIEQEAIVTETELRTVAAVDAEWEERMARLHEEMEQPAPPAWIPENPGDEIAGTLVDYNPAAHTKRGQSPVVTLQGPRGGRRSVWLHHTVLRNEFIKARVTYGEFVVIRYLGRIEPDGGGEPYAAYKVHVDRKTSSRPPDWDALAKAYGVQTDRPTMPAPELQPDDLPVRGSSQLGPDDDIPF
jgi:hypothetical protein